MIKVKFGFNINYKSGSLRVRTQNQHGEFDLKWPYVFQIYKDFRLVFEENQFEINNLDQEVKLIDITTTFNRLKHIFELQGGRVFKDQSGTFIYCETTFRNILPDFTSISQKYCDLYYPSAKKIA